MVRRFACLALFAAAFACSSDDESNVDPNANPDGGPNGGQDGAVGDGGTDDTDSGTPVISETHPRILLTDAALRTALEARLSGSPSGTRFGTLVDGVVGGGSSYAFEPWYAALVGVLRSSKAHTAYAIAKTDELVKSEETRIAAGQTPEVAGDSYLEVGDRIGNLAIVYDWCFADLTPDQRTRWLAYANQAVWNVWHHETAKWGTRTVPWSGWSVDNPSNNYFYSFLRATMLLGLASHGEDPQAQTWIDTFRQEKLEKQLFPTFTNDLQGGGSREGTGYGTALKNLFQLYWWWERSTTERVAIRTPHTLASIPHLMHAIVPTLDRLAPTGDHSRDSSAELFDYHREYLIANMAIFPNERLSRVAKSLLDQSPLPRMTQAFLFVSDFLYDPTPITAEPLTNLATAYWGSGTGQLAMRSAWTKTATYANFICGPYTESHAHKDQGSFVLHRGSWLAYDQNISTTSGIEQDEAMHNLVRIRSNGTAVHQIEGAPRCEMTGLVDQASFTYGAARITPVYKNAPSVQKVERDFLFVKPDTFVVFDRVDTTSGAERIWTLNVPGTPTANGDLLSFVAGANRIDVRRLSPTGVTSNVVAWSSAGMGNGSRVDATHATGTSSRFLHVVGTNGSAPTATRSDEAGTIGAQIGLADGRSVLVRFSDAGTGGTLEIKRADSSVEWSGALPTTVTAPPLFAN